MSEIERKVHFDEGKIILEGVQDCESLVEANKRQQTEQQTNETFRLVGRIPNIIIELWLNEELERGNTGIRMFSEEFDRLVDRKLADPDWKWLRTI